eukprot:37423-Chlamydomonas_euryale.AAC.1
MPKDARLDMLRAMPGGGMHSTKSALMYVCTMQPAGWTCTGPSQVAGITHMHATMLVGMRAHGTCWRDQRMHCGAPPYLDVLAHGHVGAGAEVAGEGLPCAQRAIRVTSDDRLPRRAPHQH